MADGSTRTDPSPQLSDLALARVAEARRTLAALEALERVAQLVSGPGQSRWQTAQAIASLMKRAERRRRRAAVTEVESLVDSMLEGGLPQSPRRLFELLN